MKKSNPRISHPREGEIIYPKVLERWAPKSIFLEKNTFETWDTTVKTVSFADTLRDVTRAETRTPGTFFNTSIPNGRRRGR